MGHSSIEGHLENRLIWRLDSIKSAKNKEQYFKNSKIFKRKGKCFVDHFLCVAFLSYKFLKSVTFNRNNLTKTLSQNSETKKKFKENKNQNPIVCTLAIK